MLQSAEKTLSAYDAKVAFLIESIIRTREVDFASLCEALPGVYPLDVMRLLRTHRFDNALTPLIRLIADSALRSAPERAHLRAQNLPHPLDFEWRFTEKSKEGLCKVMERLKPTGRCGAAVATPSINSVVGRSNFSANIDYFGLSIDAVTAGAFSHRYVRDLLRWHAIDARYDFVVTDPPWYPDYIHRFVDFATRLLVIGGVLFLVMPSIGTRPGIEAELEETALRLEAQGMLIRERRERSLNYETPHFEKNALNAAGISNVHPNWRWGDLWVVEKVAHVAVEWPGDLVLPEWKEYRFGPVRIRVRRDAPAFFNNRLSLDSLVPGDILPTVSRRDPRRAAATVWTSGNRIFSSNNTPRLHEILLGMSENRAIACAIEEQLTHLIETELHEL